MCDCFFHKQRYPTHCSLLGCNAIFPDVSKDRVAFTFRVESRRSTFDLEDEDSTVLETSGTSRPPLLSHPEVLNLQQYRCENLKCHSITVYIRHLGLSARGAVTVFTELRRLTASNSELVITFGSVIAVSGTYSQCITFVSITGTFRTSVMSAVSNTWTISCYCPISHGSLTFVTETKHARQLASCCCTFCRNITSKLFCMFSTSLSTI
jgi:hypothetical protein